jgi:hypothetical protein
MKNFQGFTAAASNLRMQPRRRRREINMNTRFLNIFATKVEFTEFLSIFSLKRSVLSFFPFLLQNFSKLKYFLKIYQNMSARGGARYYYLGGGGGEWAQPLNSQNLNRYSGCFPEGFAPLRILRRSYEYKASILICRQISYFY